MVRTGLALLLFSLPYVQAQADYYARPAPPEPYTVIWQKPPAPPPSGAQEPTPPPVQPGGERGDGGFPAYLSPVPGLNLAAPAAGPSSPPPSPIPSGLLFKVRLLTGVLATPLMDTPVLAQGEPDWCGSEACQPLVLIGTASFAPNARAVVHFHTAVLAGAVYSLNATAFDPQDRLYGLSGEVKDIAPTLAADLLRAAASGLADWIQALNRQSQVTILPGGGAATGFEAAPFWAYSLGRIGGVFALPQNTTTIVRALIRGAGETILVVSLPPEGQPGGNAPARQP